MNKQILGLAKQAGLKVESFMTDPPKPFQILGSTEQFEKFAELIIRYICIAGSLKGSTDTEEYIRGRQDLVTHIKAEFGIDGARHPWICPECNTDRSKEVCPRGYSATLRADCPIGSMQHTI